MRAVIIRALRRSRIAVLMLLDAISWVIAMYLATTLRFENAAITPHLYMGGRGNDAPLYGMLTIAGVAITSHLLIAWTFRLHQGRAGLGSFEEIFLLASAVLVSGAAATVFNLVANPSFLPRSTPVTATFIALAFCAWPRALWRMLLHQVRPNRRGGDSTPVIIVGAGEGGLQLVKSMQQDPSQRWRPVAFLDDDKRKKHFRYRGLSVLGTSENLERVASRTGATSVIVAIPSAGPELISRINELGLDAGLDVKVLPGVNDLLAGITIGAIRDLQPEDLLGRNQITTDLESIAGYLAGKRVLVTGAGGSIGSELCRQLSRFAPATLIMLDRDESALHSLLLSIYGRADLESRDVVLANIREADRVREVFEAYRPQVVFHAAALKHVNMLENHSVEAVKTNVLGTLNLLEAADEFGVERFVNISTDKAADPINILGYTKRIAEGLTAAYRARPGVFLSVRFGNVLGTNGSVLRTFAAQISANGPVTVTHPDVTRYFMTIDEAVQLVIQSAVIGGDGEALVLDMGDPVRIVDVARQMIEQSRQPINIEVTGLKPGEKLHEVLFGSGEVHGSTAHPLISKVRVAPVTKADVLGIPLDDHHTTAASVKAMSFGMDDPAREIVGP